MTDQSNGLDHYIERGEAEKAALAVHRTRMKAMRFDTIAVNGLYGMDEALRNRGSVIEPLHLSTSQHYEGSDHLEAGLAYMTPSWIYTRIDNPTLSFLEGTLALLEGYGYDGDTNAVTTASGAAAIAMATAPLLNVDGDKPINFVTTAHLYGGTFQLFNERYASDRGIEVRFVKKVHDPDEWASKIDDHTRFIYGEMPSNPTLQVMPVAAVAEVAHQTGIPLIVDATIATPALMRPLEHGADIVVHSATKSMSSGGLTIAGAVIAKMDIPVRVGPDELREDFVHYLKWVYMRDVGTALSPFNAMLVLNDLRTLRTRMDRLSKNAMQVAQFLDQHPQVEQVFYPGVESDPGHDIAQQHMWLADGADDYDDPVNRFGHLMSFTVAGGIPNTRQLYDNLRLIWRATDLGRIKSVATIPAISTHQQQGEAGRELAQIPGNMIRLNVGGEHSQDVIADLKQALATLG